MGSAIMKRVHYTVYPAHPDWGYVLTLDGKKVRDTSGFLTKKDAEDAGYKEKQRLVNKIQQGDMK